MNTREQKQAIVRTMTIEHVFSSFPQKSQKLALAMSKAGLQCVGCGAATWETLEAGMYTHGFSDEEIDSLIEKLNLILSETSDESSITLTERAAKKFVLFAEEEGKKNYALRFGDKPGGCSGYEYILDFSKTADIDDEIFHSHGVEIHVKKHLLERLLGSEIDYIEGLQAGFKISNPNAKSACGCGHSQAY